MPRDPYDRFNRSSEEYSERVETIYPQEIQIKFKEAILALKIAQIYAQRVDWYLSGDDSEEPFLKRLNEELLVLMSKELAEEIKDIETRDT